MTSNTPTPDDPLDRLYNLLAGRLAVAIWICTVILVITALYFASAVALPIVVSLLCYLALRPVVGVLHRKGLPTWIAAAGVVVALAMLFMVIGFSVVSPAQYWIRQGPSQLPRVAERLKGVIKPLKIFDRAGEQIEEFTQGDRGDEPVEVQLTAPSIIDRSVVLSKAMQLAGFLGGIALVTLFLLATGDELLNRLMMVLPSLSERRNALSLIIELQESIGRYLGTITVINFCLGCAVTLATWLCGMPTPLLWGTMAMLFNYIPYLGAYAGTAIVFFAGVAEFESIGSAFLVAGIYVTLTTIEGNFITPNILGMTLQVDPVVVLIMLTFWGFIWGLPGVIVAVPMLIVIKLCCGHFRSTRAIAVLLGDEHWIEQERDEKSLTADSTTKDPKAAA